MGYFHIQCIQISTTTAAAAVYFKQVYKLAHLPLLTQKCIHAYFFVHF